MAPSGRRNVAAVAKNVKISGETPAKQLSGFIDKYDPTVAKLARVLRSAMQKRLPTANQLVYDNYQFLAIGFSTTERASAAIANGRIPLPATGRGRTIVKSVSAKQRPRRKPTAA